VQTQSVEQTAAQSKFRAYRLGYVVDLGGGGLVGTDREEDIVEPPEFHAWKGRLPSTCGATECGFPHKDAPDFVLRLYPF
jgi:hypothetical protein